MTIVVAVPALDGSVVLAADRAADFDGTLYRARTKILRMLPDAGGPFLLGFAGAGSLPAIAERHLAMKDSPGRWSPKDTDAWALLVAERLCKIALDAGPAPVDTNGMVDGLAILAAGGRAWMIAQQQIYPITAFSAIGSGRDLALGALEGMTLGRPTATARDATQMAVDAVSVACRYDAGCDLMGDLPELSVLEET